MLKKSASIILQTREAYLVNMPSPVPLRETNDDSRGTFEEASLLEHPAGS
jgi:hypothetical protein